MPSNIIIYLFTLRRVEPLLGATMRAGILNEQQPFLTRITVEIYIIIKVQPFLLPFLFLLAFLPKSKQFPPKNVEISDG